MIFGNTIPASTTVVTPRGMLIRKIHCQPKKSINQPPRIGPQIGASSVGTFIKASNLPTRFGPAAGVRMV